MTPRIKPLEWEDADEGMCTKWRAAALGGHYELVSFDKEPGFAVNFHWGRPLSFWFIQGDPDEWGPTGPKMFPTLEDAKAAAQADYERRILSALASHEPAHIAQPEAEGLEVVAYGEVLSGKIETVRINKSRHCTEPLVRHSDAERIIVEKDAIVAKLDAEIKRLVQASNAYHEGYSARDPVILACRKRVTEAEARAAALEKALDNIRELNMTGADESGHRWANSDLIEQEIVFALSRNGEEG